MIKLGFNCNSEVNGNTLYNINILTNKKLINELVSNSARWKWYTIY